MKNTFKILSAGFALTLLLSVFCSCGLAPKQSTDEVTAVASANSVTQNDSVTQNNAAETTPTVPPAAPVTELGASWNTFRFSMFGENYQLPMLYAQFVASGWVLNLETRFSDIKPNQSNSDYFYKNNIKVYASVGNFDVDQKNYKDCYIVGIEYELKEGNATDFLLPGGIQVGRSTYDDVVAAYGVDHTEKRDYGDEEYYFSYQLAENGYSNKVELTFNNQTNVISKVAIMHNTAPADFKTSSADTAPFYNYERPTQQSTNLDDGVFSYDGKLYKLPCPLSELLSNGWTLKSGDGVAEDDIIASGSGNNAYLQYKNDYSDSSSGGTGKFDYYIRADIRNTSSKANAAKNCLVTNIDIGTRRPDSFDEFASRIGFAFPIAKKADIEKAKTDKNLNFNYSTKTDDGDVYDYYTYKPDDKLVSYRFYYYNGKLFSLEIKYDYLKND